MNALNKTSNKTTSDSDWMSWGPGLELGIQVIDEQHRQLVTLINETHDALERGAEGPEFVLVVNQLIDYCLFHFTTEEELMREYQYPDYSLHKSQHNDSSLMFFDFDTEALLADRSPVMDLLSFLNDWLINHIQGTDVQLAAFLKDKGVA